jgi:cytidylate kinase
MQIICVSKGTYSGGKDLARTLSEKMGYACLCREHLVEAATEEGIHVGKLEMAMSQARGFNRRLALERDHYLAFSRAYLCQRALEESVVYHGRTGHLLLPGVMNILRVRAVRDLERRVESVKKQMGIEREKALQYIQAVDEDRARWVRSMYGVSVEEPVNYDLTINLEQLGFQNAASAIVAVAQLPEFQMTPASLRVLKDLYLGSKARLALARNENTFKAAVNVRADSGVVTVSYLPQDAGTAPYLEPALKEVQGIEDLHITMATANLLWVQEEFEAGSPTFGKVVEIATKWNAAVELLRLAPGGSVHLNKGDDGAVVEAAGAHSGVELGGIVDDGPESAQGDGGLEKTLENLAEVGRAGGGKSVFGTNQNLVDALDRTVPYTLVVLGDLFLEKGQSARIRATRDLRAFLGDRIGAPVVTTDELGTQYLFGKRDFITTLAFAVLTAVLFFLVLSNQEMVLAYMANTGWYAEAVRGTFLGTYRWMPKLFVSVTLILFIPIVAFSYGRVASAFMKLIKME